MACGSCGNSFEAEALSGCADVTVTGGSVPIDITTYLPYILAGLGSIAFILVIMSGTKKEKAPLKIPEKTTKVR